MLTKFNEQAQKAIVISESIAFDLGHNNVGSEHLLLSILKMSDSKLRKLLKRKKIDEKMIQEDIIRLFGKNDSQPFYMEYSDVVKNVLERAISITKEKEQSKVTLDILTIALLERKESVAYELLKKYHVDNEELIFKISKSSDLESPLDTVNNLVNLNQKVRQEDYRIIGREKEIDMLCTILCKKEKSNALIIGEAGVGKSALVELLAYKINEGSVPDHLKRMIIYELSLSSMVAGTKYRGEFEEKLRKLIDKIKECKNVIIFIDEIHNLIGAGGAEGAIDAANILKPYLARRDITMIGATTIEEYYKHFEKDQAMNRRFSTITLKENTKEETFDILKSVKTYYENYHHIKVTDEVLRYLVDTVDVYIKNRTFPDKAIDIFDIACVKTKFSNHDIISKKIIKKVIEDYTQVKIEESIDYHHIQQMLKREIIGQDHAIESIINQLKVAKDSYKPEAIFLFSGSSGIGKTKTAKGLSKAMHRNLIRLDMSEYKSSASLQKIIGSPPGYIGYDKPSMLLSQLSMYPKSIVLLDEIEKAHNDVINLFLQVFDEGYLEDSQKRKVYFNHTIIIMTSNLKTRSPLLGFKKEENYQDLSRQFFPAEFINRIDEIIPFKNLSTKDLEKIIRKNSEIKLAKDEIEEIVSDYDNKQGARGVLRKLNKYILSKTIKQ